MDVLYDTENLPWMAHPSADNVSIKKIVSTERFGAESPSIVMVKVPVGEEVPEHVHETSEDILFILSGKATMWIDRIGELPLQKGTLVRVPRNRTHRIFNVSDDLVIYDVFSPGIM